MPDDHFRTRQPAAPAAFDPETAYSSREPAAHAPIPCTPDRDPPGAGKLGLSPQEITQFRESGFVIKRGLINPHTFAPFLDLFWQQPPALAAGLDREDPATWVRPGQHWNAENRWSLPLNWMGGHPWPGPEDPRPGASIGERVGRLPHRISRDIGNDVWRWHGIGHDPEFINATSAHPNVLHMAEAIMGGPVKRPWRNRGVYAVFPRDESAQPSTLGPHVDQNMTEMVVVTYLEDVPPESGGFTIFPGSPQRLYPTSRQAFHWVATEESKRVLDQIKRDTTPLEFSGKAGDVIFCHGLLLHTAGIHNGNTIRMAVIQDFNKVRPRSHMRWTAAGKNGGPRINCNMDGEFIFSDFADDDPSDGYREVTNQWIMDSNEYVVARHPPEDDMFAEWNLGQRPPVGFVLHEPPWWQKYNLPSMTANSPRGGGGLPAVPLSSIARYEGNRIWRVQSRANDWMQGLS